MEGRPPRFARHFDDKRNRGRKVQALAFGVWRMAERRACRRASITRASREETCRLLLLHTICQRR